MENPPKQFFRLSPGREVRLRSAYFVACTGVLRNEAGEVVEVRCTHDPATRGGDSPDGRKVKATLHWVSARHAIPARVRLFDRLFNAEEPGARTGNVVDDINPASLREIENAWLEPSFAEVGEDEPRWPDAIRRFQLERLGYFCLDPDSTPAMPVLNRTVTLKDSWAKAVSKGP